MFNIPEIVPHFMLNGLFLLWKVKKKEEKERLLKYKNCEHLRISRECVGVWFTYCPICGMLKRRLYGNEIYPINSGYYSIINDFFSDILNESDIDEYMKKHTKEVVR